MAAGSHVPDTVEREVKLAFASADEARAAVASLGASPVRSRRLQDDRLLDAPDGRLRSAGITLRVRVEGDRDTATVTLKGPAEADLMKVREEIETGVVDGMLLLRMLERLGFVIWFRYQKFRAEFARDGVVIAVDETPVATFVELEGDRGGITRLAAALGRTPDDYIVDSYRQLFVRHCRARGLPAAEMMFSNPPEAVRR